MKTKKSNKHDTAVNESDQKMVCIFWGLHATDQHMYMPTNRLTDFPGTTEVQRKSLSKGVAEEHNFINRSEQQT